MKGRKQIWADDEFFVPNMRRLQQEANNKCGLDLSDRDITRVIGFNIVGKDINDFILPRKEDKKKGNNFNFEI